MRRARKAGRNENPSLEDRQDNWNANFWGWGKSSGATSTKKILLGAIAELLLLLCVLGSRQAIEGEEDKEDEKGDADVLKRVCFKLWMQVRGALAEALPNGQVHWLSRKLSQNGHSMVYNRQFFAETDRVTYSCDGCVVDEQLLFRMLIGWEA